MKFKDIIYKITHDIISPATMGVFAEEVISWSTSCRCYMKSCLTVNKVLELYNHFDPEEEVPNYISEEIIAHGFCKRYVYYFIVDVPEDTNIVYYPYIPESEHRHWINGKLAFIGGPLYVYTATLCKGLNIFCIEKFTEGIPNIRIQIKEDSQNLLLSLTENNYWYESNRFEIIHNKHIQNGEPFQFNLIPLDLINLDFDSVITMEIRAGEQGIILYKQELSFKESYAIDLSFIPNMNENACERLYVYFSTKNKKGETINKRTYLFRHSIDTNYISLLIEKASNLLNSVEVPRLIKDEIRYYLQVMTDQMTYFYFGVQLKRIVEAYENGDSLTCLISQPGPHNIYYYSEINNNYHHYYLVLPSNYNPHKKYPLLLTFQYGHVNNYEPPDSTSNFSAKFIQRKDAIYADIGGDGCTMGSYTGEAFLLAEINHIMKNFSVDNKRIFAIANCAGNIAAFNFVGTYPHLFAGIYTRSIEIDKCNIRNLSNVFCMYVCSGHNSSIAKDSKLLDKYLNKKKILYANKNLDKFVDLILVQYTKPAMDLLFSRELEEYPKYIYYKTERNRALRGYYIKIKEIRKGKKFAEFQAKIDNNHLIIKTKNCTGLKIDIPPQIDRNQFIIEINGKSIVLNNFTKRQVFLRQSPKNGFELCECFDENIIYYKGSGLLDVYLSSMRTVNCNFNDRILTKVSNLYAHPKASTKIKVNVSYPIISMDDISENINSSLVIIDNNCIPNNDLILIRSTLIIQMDEKGFTYENHSVVGPYCIAQIIANPWNKDKSVLYINTNDKNLYEENIITRILMVPSYSTGYHPFLNGVALLFDGNNYYTVAEYGDDIIKLI